jgi:ABC-type sugar transport system ATPase subunit
VLDRVKRLAVREQLGVLLISHRLDEILTAADSVAVLRAGRIVLDEPTCALTHDRLVENIVGVPIGNFYPDRQEPDRSEPVLEVAKLTGTRVHGLTFEVRPGEVMGFTGLPGSGFEDIPYLLLDPALVVGGTCVPAGKPLDLRRTSIRSRLARAAPDHPTLIALLGQRAEWGQSAEDGSREVAQHTAERADPRRAHSGRRCRREGGDLPCHRHRGGVDPAGTHCCGLSRFDTIGRHRLDEGGTCRIPL